MRGKNSDAASFPRLGHVCAKIHPETLYLTHSPLHSDAFHCKSHFYSGRGLVFIQKLCCSRGERRKKAVGERTILGHFQTLGLKSFFCIRIRGRHDLRPAPRLASTPGAGLGCFEPLPDAVSARLGCPAWVQHLLPGSSTPRGQTRLPTAAPGAAAGGTRAGSGVALKRGKRHPKMASAQGGRCAGSFGRAEEGSEAQSIPTSRGSTSPRQGPPRAAVLGGRPGMSRVQLLHPLRSRAVRGWGEPPAPFPECHVQGWSRSSSPFPAGTVLHGHASSIPLAGQVSWSCSTTPGISRPRWAPEPRCKPKSSALKARSGTQHPPKSQQRVPAIQTGTELWKDCGDW